MPDYLLIRGHKPARVVEALAVAAELVEQFPGEAQVDIVTPADYADYARVSDTVRRVIGVTMPDLSDMEGLQELTSEEGGWKGKMFSAAKKLSAAAGSNLRTYRALMEELRLVNYDVVFDFDASAFSLMVGKLAKAGKIIGFDPDTLSSPAPGAGLMYHEAYRIPDKEGMNISMRLRQLVGRHFNYSSHPGLDWRIRSTPPPAWAPSPPFILLDDRVPSPFVQVLQEKNLTLIGGRAGYPDGVPEQLSVEDRICLARAADAVFGGDEIATLAAAVGTKTLFIGDARECPERAILVTTPAGLTEALSAPTPPPASPPAEQPAAAAPSSGGEEESGLDPVTPPSSPDTTAAADAAAEGTTADSDDAGKPSSLKLKK